MTGRWARALGTLGTALGMLLGGCSSAVDVGGPLGSGGYGGVGGHGTGGVTSTAMMSSGSTTTTGSTTGSSNAGSSSTAATTSSAAGGGSSTTTASSSSAGGSSSTAATTSSAAGGGSSTTASSSSGGGCAACMTGFLCCNGTCTNPNNDILNCGGCNMPCGGAHPYCDNGVCGTPPACTGTACATTDFCCGPNCCAAGLLCCAVPGPVAVGLQCTAPVNGTCPTGCTDCKCASPDTPIATPRGDRRIADLVAGDLVYSVEHDAIVAVPVLRANRTPVHDHHVVRVVLATGVVLEISPRHPTADGRTFGDLREGHVLDRIAILSVELIPYKHPYTYDILPASDTHTYFAGGALIGTTLEAR